MRHACPKCKTAELRSPIEADGNACATEEVTILRCERCRGTWLSQDMIACVAQSDDRPTLNDAQELLNAEGADKRTGLCPMGHGILIRARVQLDAPFFLERCAKCGGIWFDAGEWRRLASSHLLRHLQEFWTPTWRRERRENALRDAYLADLRADLGTVLFDKLMGLTEALRDHPHRERALIYLRRELSETDD